VLLSHPFEALAALFAIQPILLPVREPVQIERAIDMFASEPNVGLLFPPDVTLYIHRQLVTSQVARNRLPAIYSDSVMVKSGGSPRLLVGSARRAPAQARAKSHSISSKL
jgi:hypothetical protein